MSDELRFETNTTAVHILQSNQHLVKGETAQNVCKIGGIVFNVRYTYLLQIKNIVRISCQANLLCGRFKLIW